ncbi:monooxygenase [Kitasatospora sp. MMS16-BH015]|uniref:LLM class flavin-dependent oxidoreductase n=1 Tax=Kitasatospora sp. MMS16-BH015 TaxID=2018025 RepID=UPI000CA137CC|nr:LLM class flavin-dependent oxidoreductase [Kitasatospora sp. MMS16-BH015]AUG77885.1 monooxygenase [Kitasatospora sp. MMS16-BH015]
MDDLRFGVHSGQLHGSFEACLRLWEQAEDLGYDWISLFDFLRPWAFAPDSPCFEGNTLLAALAARTHRIRCAMLVSPVTWRHPALTANIAATLDHVSGGRLEFGVGAGGTDRGYEQYGIPFPAARERLDMLDEACTVLRRLWTEDETSFAGRHFRLDRACLAPKPLQPHLPLIVGGDGVRRTVAIAARHADIWNALPFSPELYQRKADAFDAACATIGRDPGEVRKSITFRAVVTRDEAETARRAAAELADTPEALRAQYISFGTVEECVEALRPYVRMGVRDFLLAVKAPVDWQTLELVATQVAPAVRSLARAAARR